MSAVCNVVCAIDNSEDSENAFTCEYESTQCHDSFLFHEYQVKVLAVTVCVIRKY